MQTNLIDFRMFLDEGTFDGLRYKDNSKSRYESFKYCIEHLKKDCKILELGTTRSFVDGKFEGCNSNDTKFWKPLIPEFWDWGAGCFSLIFAKVLPECKITSIDLIRSHIERAKYMCETLGIINVKHEISNSLEYLNNTNEKFDLIYLDTGDMHPIEPTIELQLTESEIIVKRNLLNTNGLILIDDVLNGTQKEFGNLQNTLGKSEKSIPYLLQNGFKTVFEGYQYILKKK